LDKVYLNTGNALTKECENHFSGFCFKCGYGNHTADACRIYDSKLVLTLCQVCQRGFHDQCKNRYAIENKSGNNSKDRKGRSNQANQANQILDGFSNIVNKHTQQHPVYPVVPMPMGMVKFPIIRNTCKCICKCKSSILQMLIMMIDVFRIQCTGICPVSLLLVL
jgi:hypothetical protein